MPRAKALPLESRPLTYLYFFILVFALYFNTLGNGFLYDEQALIINNPYIKSFRHIPQLFTSDVFHFGLEHSDKYRPLSMLAYAVDYFFWGLKPFGYHLTNIFLHALNGFLIFRLLKLIFQNDALAILSATFFCVNPVNLKAVAVIGNRSVILEAAFMLLSLCALLTAYLRRGKTRSWLALVYCLLALLCREAAVFLPLYVFVCLSAAGAKRKEAIRCAIPFIILASAYLFFRLFYFKLYEVGPAVFAWQKIPVFLLLLHNFVTRAILGRHAVFYGPLLVRIIQITVVSAAVLFYAIMLSRLWLRDKKAWFGLALFAIGSLPFYILLHNIQFYGVLVFEHYGYLACFGLSFLFAYLCLGFYRIFPKLTAASVVLLLTLWSGITVAANANYKNEEIFYRHILAIDKNNALALLNLADIYFKRNMLDAAEAVARKVLLREPDAWDAYLTLGNICRKRGQLKEAAEFYRQAVFFKPAIEGNHLSLGMALAQQGRFNEAEAVFKQALTALPKSVNIRKDLGALYGNQGKFAQAISVWQEALRLQPDNEEIKKNIQRAKDLRNKGSFRD
jgi:Tfp pilus assembly protein PilF